jgi:hypothetical protein
MFRALTVCAVLLAWPLSCRADEKKPTETVIRLTVQPAAAPKPALKYLLLPELGEMNPGNPAHGYLKAFAEQNNFFFAKEAVEKREKWLTIPLKDLPLKEVRDAGYYGSALRHADYAARLTTPDWQILPQIKTEGSLLLLPDIQQMRLLASALKVRFRAEVAEGRFDDALVTAKTMFALARHLGEHPTLIGNLVGIAITQIGLDPLEEMIGQPGSPNLYWALTDLPSPFISFRKGIMGERLFLFTDFGPLVKKEPASEAELQEVVRRLSDMVRFEVRPGRPKPDVAGYLQKRAKDEAQVRQARKRLAEAGHDRDFLKKVSPLQVILLDEKFTYEIQRDEWMKAMALPYWQGQHAIARVKAAKPARETPLAVLVPPYDKVRLAQVRLDQRIALLRGVEALRLYAAENGGKLPAKLDDLSVPVPIDPVTGKPIRYERIGAKAILRGTPPAGMEKEPAYNVRYEVTVAR